jgi:hypothetical protein
MFEIKMFNSKTLIMEIRNQRMETVLLKYLSQYLSRKNVKLSDPIIGILEIQNFKGKRDIT